MKYNKEIKQIIAALKPNEKAHLTEKRFRISGKTIVVVYAKNLSGALRIISGSLWKCSRALKPRTNITFVVTNTADKFIAKNMGGVGGFTLNRSLIHLRINTKAYTWKKMLVSTVAHEFNHTVRFSVFNQETNLRGYLASEGLAQYFETEIGGNVPPWALALNTNRAKKVWKKIAPYLDRRGWNIYTQVFFGSGNKFPQWAGYAISYLIVKEYLGGTKPDWNALMKVSSKELIKIFY